MQPNITIFFKDFMGQTSLQNTTGKSLLKKMIESFWRFAQWQKKTRLQYLSVSLRKKMIFSKGIKR